MIRIFLNETYDRSVAEQYKKAIADGRIGDMSYHAARVVDRSTRQLLLILKGLKLFTIDSIRGLNWPEDQKDQELLSRTDSDYMIMTEALAWVKESGGDSVRVTLEPYVRHLYF